MRPLVITPEVKAKGAALIHCAESNAIPFAELKKIVTGVRPPSGDDPRFTLCIDHGFRVAYTVEQHYDQWLHHASVSVDTPKRVPNHLAVQAILNEVLQIPGTLAEFQSYIEKLQEDINAVNLLKPYSREWSRAGGDVECPVCAKKYYEHPRHFYYAPCRLICDGSIVKL
jgi:hypothetical protein